MKKYVTQKEILNEVLNFDSKYCDLVWYARSSSDYDHIDGVIECRNKVEELYPKEVEELLTSSDPEWVHGFNSGMMAGMRFILEMKYFGKEFAESTFPNLDT